MGYKAISSSLYAIGKGSSQRLWKFVKNNFDSHEDRIADLELTSSICPPGFKFEYVGDTAPDGFLMCDGSAVSQATYADLFAVLGFTYGNPGGGNFSLPDQRGRCTLGAGAGSGLTSRTLGATGGEETHVLTTTEIPSHTHAKTDPGHTHPMASGGSPVQNYIDPGGVTPGAGGMSGTDANPVTPPTFSYGNNTTGGSTNTFTIANTGSGTAHNNIQPSLAFNVIIKT